MNENENERLIKIINKFPKQRIMVIGDLIVDHYLWCSVERISPEAPVPVARIKNENYILGGAANVANNLAALGAKVDLVSLAGDDDLGRRAKVMLNKNKIGRSGLFVSRQRPTTIKTRVFCNNHQLIRIDRETTNEIQKPFEKKIINHVFRNLAGVKTIVFSDYAKGFISESISQTIINKVRDKKIKVLADPTPTTLFKFKDSFLIKANKREAEGAVGEKINDDYSNLRRVGEMIQRQTRAKIVITLGRGGMALFDGERFTKIASLPEREVYNVIGAGDTAMAGLALAISAGASPEEAVAIGNMCAGIVVGKMGTAVCTTKELLDRIRK